MCRPSRTPHPAGSPSRVRTGPWTGPGARIRRGPGGPRPPKGPRHDPPPRTCEDASIGRTEGEGPAGAAPPSPRRRRRERRPDRGALPPSRYQRVSEAASGVVVFHGPRAASARSHLFYASGAATRRRTRVKLNRVFFPRCRGQDRSLDRTPNGHGHRTDKICHLLPGSKRVVSHRGS